jgi:hypothetical protein
MDDLDSDSVLSRPAIQLLADWTPSSVDPLLGRFDALLKIPRGAVLEDGTTQLLLLDDQGRVLTATNIPLQLEGVIAGPSSKLVRGGLVRLSEGTTHAVGILNDVRSAPVARLDATIPVLLRAIARQVGIAGEPHLWWRFYNRTSAPIHVGRIFETSVLHVDDRTFSPRAAPYNGPAELPPKRAVSGLWSLDDFDATLRRGLHRFQLSILGEASEPLAFEWQDPP